MMLNNEKKKNSLITGILNDLKNKKVPKAEDYGADKQEFGDTIDMLIDSKLIKNAVVSRGGLGNKALFIDLKTAKITLSGIKYLDESNREEVGKVMQDSEKSHRKIFINHSGDDQKLISLFNEKLLVNGIGIHLGDIACTSNAGMTAEPGGKWTDYIKENIKSCDTVIAIVTPNFKKSEVCLNEIGAAWILDKHTIVICVDPITELEATVLFSSTQIENLFNEEGLDRIRDSIIKRLKIKELGTDIWTKQRKEFMTQVGIYLKKFPFKPFVTEKKFEKLQKELNDLTELYSKLIDEKDELKEINEKLKKCKNRDEVNEIIDEYKDTSLIEEVRGLISDASEIINRFHPSIITLLYNSYADRNLEIDHQLYKNYIEEAIGNSIINDDDLSALWYDNPLLQKLHNTLKRLKSIFSELNEEDYDTLTKEYGQDLNVKKLDFWKEVLQVKMYYN